MKTALPQSLYPIVEDNFYLWIKKNFSGSDFSAVEQAWIFVVQKYGLSKRRDGSTALSHFKAVAAILQAWGFPPSYVIAGLLHDLVEDTDVQLELIVEKFGSDVGGMVEFMSRNLLAGYEDYTDKVKKILTKNSDYVFIRFADQMHNLLSPNGYRNNGSLLDSCRELLWLMKLQRGVIKSWAQKNSQANIYLLRLKQKAEMIIARSK